MILFVSVILVACIALFSLVFFMTRMWDESLEEYEREMNKVTKEFFGEEWCD